MLSCGLISANELRFGIRADPRTFDPLLSSDEASDTVRYITGGVLLRFDRVTQQLRPELAQSWRMAEGGRRIEFTLRENVRFSDGTPFDAADVEATVRRLNDPTVLSGVADTFRAGGQPIGVSRTGPYRIALTFPAPVAGVEYLFDQLAIRSSRSPLGDRAVLGPFLVAEHKGGQYVLLRRNPFYWKRDASGKQLPYLDTVRLQIQTNRELEMVQFRRGDLHMIDKVEPATFERLRKEMPAAAVDAGPSLDSEILWFNQAPQATIAPHKSKWFRSARFRLALSGAINRADIARVIYRGLATPAVGHIAPSNKVWHNAGLRAQGFHPARSLAMLAEEGLRLKDGVLQDAAGNPVSFSMITNANSKPRVQIAALVQEDLRKIGVAVNIVPLEFGSLVSRITQNHDYEACLLGFSNVEPNPMSQANVFRSSGNLHAWNPGQKVAATAWEAEIDRILMRQASAAPAGRKKAFDRIQEIFVNEMPILYLVHPNALMAVSPTVRNAAVTPLPPRLYWNIESLRLSAR